MKENKYILKSKRFLPLFVTQFLGAFNDNVFKNAIVILITYVTAEKLGLNAQIMVTLAAGIFILPFFLFSSMAGQIADKFEKSRLIRIIKTVEIMLMLVAGVGFFTENVYLLMTVLFFMGAQSAFFGPLKYSILPDHLADEELVSGNALIEMGTFLTILLETSVGSLLILKDNGIGIITLCVIIVSVLGYISARFIPHSQAVDPSLKINPNIIAETWNIITYAANKKDVFLSILGISWFWLIGAMFLSQFPTFAKDVVGGNEEIVTLFITLFSIGIGIGSLLCNRLLKGQINASYVPLGVIGITLFTVDLYWASSVIVKS